PLDIPFPYTTVFRSRVIDMSRSQVQSGAETDASLVDGKLVDAEGNIIGEAGEIARDASGKILGRVVDGKLVDADGKVLGTVKDRSEEHTSEHHHVKM